MTAPNLQDWVGREMRSEDMLDTRQARLMRSILPGPPLGPGAALPPLWHWLYFNEGAPLDALGRDGHPARGGFLPPVPLPRRMWAGGRLEFPGDLRVGEQAVRTSRILAVTEKTGASGPLCFVTVEHRFTVAGALRLREEHDIVYRADPAPGAPAPVPPAAPEGAGASETVTPSEVMLFRYSALTFNGHRIHYDRDYCREVEGYPGLVFHGPLTGTLLADLAARRLGPLARFSFRAISPLYDTAPFTLQAGTGGAFWAATPEGRLAMRAAAEAR